MSGTHIRENAAIEQLESRLLDDPWSLDLEQRATLAESLAASQSEWSDRLPNLVEPPAPNGTFPGWLLGTDRFRGLREQIGTATQRSELTTAAADELQRFVDLYRDYATTLAPRDGDDATS